MISVKISEELITQMNREYEAEMQYRAMANWLDFKDWSGFAHFMIFQAEEEKEHGDRIRGFLLKSSNKSPEINGIDNVKNDFDNVQHVFRYAYDQEHKMSTYISNINQKISKYKQYQAIPLINWFHEEQVEEEDLMDTALTKIKRANNNASAMMRLDEKFGSRETEEFFA